MRTPLRTTALAVGLLVVITACGAEEPQAATTTTAVETTSPEPAIATTLPAVRATTTTVPVTTTTTLDPVEVVIADGEVTGPDRFTVDLGETVSIVVLSDVGDEIHVHGYDLFFDIAAGVPLTIEFVAEVPGVFEVEVHTGHTHIFDIEVAG